MMVLRTAAALLLLSCAFAFAQQQILVPTRPLGDSTNAAANTSFVQGAVINLLSSNNTWTGTNNFTNTLSASPSFSVTGSAPLSANGVLFSGVYGSGVSPVQVTAASFAPSMLASFFTTSGDRGQTQYTTLFVPNTTGGGQGGNWYAGSFTSTISGTWIPAASGLSGAIGVQGGGISSRGGYTFGGNTYCTTQTTTATQCVGIESDTNATVATTDKIAFQAVDILSSTGAISGISAGYLVGAQSGAALYKTGLFIAPGNGVFPLQTSGTGIQITGGTVTHGIDLTGLTCSTDCIKSPVPVYIGGGAITTGMSVTAGNGNVVDIFSGTTKAIRFGFQTTNAAIEGVDNTGVGSFQPLFVGGSTLTFQISGVSALAINAASHFSYSGGTAPINSACTGFTLGTGSSDTAGKVTFTSATSCAITFGTTFTNPPFCNVTPGTSATPSTVDVVTTAGGFTATFTTAQTSLYYNCAGA